jgi:hypothetical protein
MKNFSDLILEIQGRGEEISPLLPRANWVHLKGHFTPGELRQIADEVESKFKGPQNDNQN